MAFRILIAETINPESVQELRNSGYEVTEQFYEEDQIGEILRDFDAVVIRFATRIKEPQIDMLSGGRLKLIVRAGVGLDNVAVKYAEEHGIAVRNTPRASTNGVAELAIGLMISCARHISDAGYTMRSRRWDNLKYFHGFELEGKTLGIIGYGRIGQLLGRKAQALGMNVLSVVHKNKPDGCECDTMHFVSMDELLETCDIISLCLPGGGTPIVTRETIAKMKDGVVIINVSRSSNIDDDALLEALNSGKVRAAGLDVWIDKDPNWELAKHPNVSGTPHLGAGTDEAQEKTSNEVIEIIKTLLPN